VTLKPTPVALPVPTASVAIVPVAPSSNIPVPSQSASAPAAAGGRSELALFGDGTRVRVDGVARGSCPTRVNVGPGVHTVEFSFPATGESEVETLSLQAGEKATLRADFTGARPTIRIEH